MKLFVEHATASPEGVPGLGFVRCNVPGASRHGVIKHLLTTGVLVLKNSPDNELRFGDSEYVAELLISGKYYLIPASSILKVWFEKSDCVGE